MTLSAQAVCPTIAFDASRHFGSSSEGQDALQGVDSEHHHFYEYDDTSRLYSTPTKRA
jgi:hypothetical protein